MSSPSGPPWTETTALAPEQGWTQVVVDGDLKHATWYYPRGLWIRATLGGREVERGTTFAKGSLPTVDDVRRDLFGEGPPEVRGRA